MPLDSEIDASRNKMDKIGAMSGLPGSINQKDPNTPKKIGVRKYLINLLLIKLASK
tara:strand:- start:38189 stop:38356 length:168 start_codon:yes stop_codon:yes gene_type:complete